MLVFVQPGRRRLLLRTTDTVANVKVKVQEKTGIPPKQQRRPWALSWQLSAAAAAAAAACLPWTRVPSTYPPAAATDLASLQPFRPNLLLGAEASTYPPVAAANLASPHPLQLNLFLTVWYSYTLQDLGRASGIDCDKSAWCADSCSASWQFCLGGSARIPPPRVPWQQHWQQSRQQPWACQVHM